MLQLLCACATLTSTSATALHAARGLPAGSAAARPACRAAVFSSLQHVGGSAATRPAGRAAVFASETGPLTRADIRWKELDPQAGDSEPSEGATVMPLFPLGVTYLPYTSPVLNIFEPRYRAMYNDILFSGARRFMVCNVDGETGQLAETGVIFYLDELKEVSEQTNDRVKYVGQHSVIGRVKLLKVLNPSVAATRETYLKAEVETLEDADADEAPTDAEEALRKLFYDLVDVQAALGEEPRFTEAVKETLQFGRGSGSDDKGLWGTVLLWQQFLEQRASVVGQKMQREIQKEVVTYLKNNEIDNDKVNSRGEMRLEDLPEPLRNEIQSIQRRYREELEAMESDPYGLQFQALLQSDSHVERIGVFQKIIDTERKRLAARQTLQSMFKASSSDD